MHFEKQYICSLISALSKKPVKNLDYNLPADFSSLVVQRNKYIALK